uniref:G_PROTEIN_RECEP_F1_2 domain-containing protein n=1 Tax=Macrostomum lignano TaxID=282301 RepID=A0A1I8FU65_9PLAT
YEVELYATIGEYRAHKWLNWVASPALFCIGTAGNVLLIWLLLPNCKATATYRYLVLLGLLDQMVLTSGLLSRWLQHAFGFSLERTGLVACLINKFASYFASTCSALLIGVVSLERALAIRSPLRAARMQSGRRLRLVMLAVVTFSLLANCHWLFILDHHYVSASDDDVNATNASFEAYPMCDIRESAQHLSSILSVADAVLYSVVPLVVIFTCNATTIAKLRQARLRRLRQLSAVGLDETAPGVSATKVKTKTTNSRSPELVHWRAGGARDGKVTADAEVTAPLGGSSSGSGSRIRELANVSVCGSGVSGGSHVRSPMNRRASVQQVTVLLLSISTFYLVASLPVALLKILTTIAGVIDTNAVNSDYRMYSQYRLAETITYLCMYSNH